tara:strand:- start:68 stop:343 length:276 start_codon:yes stop_codon:yes gene_type:complete
MRIKKINKCRFCKSKDLKKILSLGYQNLQGYFKDKNKINEDKFIKQKFLTELVKCDTQKNIKACGLLQPLYLYHLIFYIKNTFIDQALIQR